MGLYFILMKIFQSTHPVRGGTYEFVTVARKCFISIHPPREGWDSSGIGTSVSRSDFNPPTP